MPEILRVVRWEEHFEDSRTRQYKSLSWIPIPNKHDGEGFAELLSGHPNGTAHFGAWILMLQVASKCEPRGLLVRDGDVAKPHTPRSLSTKTRSQAEIFEEAIPRLIEIGWLEVVTQENALLERNPAVAEQSSAASGIEPALTRPDQPNPEETRNKPAGRRAEGEVEFSVLRKVETKHLKRTVDLVAIHDALHRENPEAIPDDDETLVCVVAATERSTEVADNPLAFFRAMIRRRNWELISGDQRSRAKMRLREWREQQSVRTQIRDGPNGVGA